MYVCAVILPAKSGRKLMENMFFRCSVGKDRVSMSHYVLSRNNKCIEAEGGIFENVL
jgi:hypothetical protein